MQYGDYFDRGSADTIYDNEIGVSHEFACARDPPEAVQTRMVW